jgi:type IV secretory pathway VirB10-like protein
MSDEQKISQRYRELGREEPPRHLDDQILSAARGAVETRPAPLVVPTGRRRWYFPLAAAAVIVLAVAVTVHVERERPDLEAVVAPSADLLRGKREELRDMAKAEKAAPPPQAAPAQPFTPDPKPQARPEPAPTSPPQAMKESQPAAAADQRTRDQDRLDSQRLAHERQRQEMRRESAAGVAASRPAPASRADEPAGETPALAKLAQQSPEQWLLGIDDLKRQGKHEEAERQLAEFRKRYPNYRIPEAISEKFEKR